MDIVAPTKSRYCTIWTSSSPRSPDTAPYGHRRPYEVRILHHMDVVVPTKSGYCTIWTSSSPRSPDTVPYGRRRLREVQQPPHMDVVAPAKSRYRPIWTSSSPRSPATAPYGRRRPHEVQQPTQNTTAHKKPAPEGRFPHNYHFCLFTQIRRTTEDLIIDAFVGFYFLNQALQPEFLQFVQKQAAAPFEYCFKLVEADDFE